MQKKKLLQGIDLFDFSILKNKKTALITNHTGINKDGVSTVKLFLRNNVDLRVIFSLEHGYFPVAQDMESVGNEEKVQGVPVISLYGHDKASLMPQQALFDLFDTVVYDIQDIGSRYYTYLQSLTLFMDKLQNNPKELIILDRINPINGTIFEGSMIEPHYFSFVGLFPILHRHGLTSGEIAKYYYELKKYSFPMEIIKASGWQRDSFFDEYDYPWIPTSPNMPTLDTAICYPGGCLIEGTELSEGRGTTAPFLTLGKKGINPFELKDKLDKLEIPGIRFMPLEFRPAFQKEAMARCGGVYLHIANRREFKPLRAYIRIINAFRDMLGDEKFFRKKPYEFVEDVPAIELLLGSRTLIDMFYRKADFTEIDAILKEEENRFAGIITPFMLY